MQFQELGQLLAHRDPRSSGSDGAAQVVSQFEALLRHFGAYEALALINARTRFRFTCVDRFDSPMLRSVFMIDRENPGILSGGSAQAIDDTYASFVRQGKRPFFTEYSLQDARLGLHTARVAIISYAGAPIHLSNGRLWGVLSHYDFKPRAVLSQERALLPELAVALAIWLKSEGLTEVDVPLAG
jgi:GAF domain-containing protein